MQGGRQSPSVVNSRLRCTIRCLTQETNAVHMDHLSSSLQYSTGSDRGTQQSSMICQSLLVVLLSPDQALLHWHIRLLHCQMKRVLFSSIDRASCQPPYSLPTACPLIGDILHSVLRAGRHAHLAIDHTHRVDAVLHEHLSASTTHELSPFAHRCCPFSGWAVHPGSERGPGVEVVHHDAASSSTAGALSSQRRHHGLSQYHLCMDARHGCSVHGHCTICKQCVLPSRQPQCLPERATTRLGFQHIKVRYLLRINCTNTSSSSSSRKNALEDLTIQSHTSQIFCVCVQWRSISHGPVHPQKRIGMRQVQLVLDGPLGGRQSAAELISHEFLQQHQIHTMTSTGIHVHYGLAPKVVTHLRGEQSRPSRIP